MTAFAPTRISRKLWTIAFGERAWVEKTGDFRAKEKYGLIHRPNYAYGMLRAADVAKYFGHSRVTAIEFGVAGGDGLRNMIRLADLIEAETGVTFDLAGFDAGEGLPSVDGHRDHPEIWSSGDFANPNKDGLAREVQGKADIVWGDIRDTLPTHKFKSPLGFISVDVDIYSATVSALSCLTRSPQDYLPAISMYFDDVSFFFANQWCGELLAISEFNAANDYQKIDLDRSLASRPMREGWPSHMYVCHVLDHPRRQQPASRNKLDISSHGSFMRERHLF